jgi:nitrite reductase (NO-forming)
VYTEGGSIPNRNVQTTLVPPGGASIVDFKAEVPGTYILVDHALFRTFNKGSLGMLKIAGAEDKVVYSGQEVDEAYLGDRGPGAIAAGGASSGEALYLGTCATCHQRDGKGIPNVFPPLASSDYLMADKTRSIELVIAGRTGDVVVNGVKYTGAMPPLSNLTDHEIASVLTYVRTNLGNKGDAVTDAEVAAVRARVIKPPTGAHP